MVCPYCSGIGYVHNKKIDGMSNYDAFERDIPFQVKCKACGGSGFIVGNAKEAIKMLNTHIKDKEPMSVREMKQLRKILIL